MTPAFRPLAEINQQAIEILIREIGVVDTLRFLDQFQAGSGNYTKERGQMFDDLSLDKITTEIKAKRHRQG
jgi:hypothetical protein